MNYSLNHLPFNWIIYYLLFFFTEKTLSTLAVATQISKLIIEGKKLMEIQ